MFSVARKATIRFILIQLCMLVCIAGYRYPHSLKPKSLWAINLRPLVFVAATNTHHNEMHTLQQVDKHVIEDEAYSERWSQTMSVLFEPIPTTASGVVRLCDRIEQSEHMYRMNGILRHKRRKALQAILLRNRDEYITVVSFLGSRIPREELPNAQGIQWPKPKQNLLSDVQPSEHAEFSSLVRPASTDVVNNNIGDSGPAFQHSLVGDCELPDLQYRDSVLDRFLLARFRGLVQKEIGFASQTKGRQQRRAE